VILSFPRSCVGIQTNIKINAYKLKKGKKRRKRIASPFFAFFCLFLPFFAFFCLFLGSIKRINLIIGKFLVRLSSYHIYCYVAFSTIFFGQHRFKLNNQSFRFICPLFFYICPLFFYICPLFFYICS